MKFDFNEEQRLVDDSVRRFVQQDYGFEARRRIVASREGWSREVWGKIAEIGLLALPIPAEYGGFGGRAIDLMSVMEAFGEALLVEPYLSTLLAARLVAKLGGDSQKSEILPAVAEGRMVIVFTHGATRGVLHAPCADRFLVPAKVDGVVRLFLVERGDVKLDPFATLDEMPAADIEVDAAKAVPLGEGDAAPAIEEALDHARALLCAEAVGAMKFANDTTLAYLKTRKQFGVPIGAFQALQHRMVDMVIEQEQARSMATLACGRVDGGVGANERARIVSAAKVKIGDAARRISQESVQLHGGMGMSDELKVSHTFRRLTILARELGDVDHHLERFARISPRPS